MPLTIDTNLIAAAGDAASATMTVGGDSGVVSHAPVVFLAVGVSAMLATFVASVMADEQSERLRNGTFGAIAGSSIGGIAALITSQHELLIIGFLGSAIGAFLGWIAILVLSLVARKGGRDWLEYYVGGFKGLRSQIELDNEQKLLAAVAKWRLGFSKMIDEQKHELCSMTPSPTTDLSSARAMRTWLVISTEFFGLIFETLAKKPEYRSRAGLLVYGTHNKKTVGKLWLKHIGSLTSYKAMDFDETSIGYKVLTGEIESPHFTTTEEAKKKGQNRGPSQQEYRPFYILKVNKNVVLVVDWPEDVKENDPYIAVAIDVFKYDIGPAMEALLGNWSLASTSQIMGLEDLVIKP